MGAGVPLVRRPAEADRSARPSPPQPKLRYRKRSPTATWVFDPVHQETLRVLDQQERPEIAAELA